MVKELILSQGKIAIVDDEDYDLKSKELYGDKAYLNFPEEYNV
jgi:hypothetical protein